jgi:hypothetical protein
VKWLIVFTGVSLNTIVILYLFMFQAGSLEGQHFRKTGVLRSLSVQQIVDCSRQLANTHGCHGGLPDKAYHYLMDVGGDESWNAYPYAMNVRIIATNYYPR